MQFFYALLFFILSTSVVSASFSHAAADAYWVLKTPNDNNRFSGMVLQIIDGGNYLVLTLDENFGIVSKRQLEPQEEAFLLGVWHPVPTRASQQLAELTFSVNPTGGIKSTLSTSSTHTVSSAKRSRLLSESPKAGNGYWVLRNAKKAAESWRDIVQIEDGKYFTFSLDENLKIIRGSRTQVEALLPGDYFRIPFKGMETKYRFAVLKVRKKNNKMSVKVQY